MPAVSDSLHLTGPQPAPQAAADSVATDSMVFNTVIVDSIGADTVHGRIPHFIPVDKADSLRVEAYADSLEAYSALPEVPQGSREGVARSGAEHHSHTTPALRCSWPLCSS